MVKKEKPAPKKAPRAALQYKGETESLSNSRSWMDFLDKETLSLFPGKDSWRKRLINTMLIWAEKSTSLEVMQFCIQFKIPYTTLREWDNKYPDIHDAYVFMKLMIATHRKVGSMTKKLDGTYAYKDMHMYDPEWHPINKYHSDMKKEEEKQAHTFIISDAKPRIVTKEEMTGIVEGRKDNDDERSV